MPRATVVWSSRATSALPWIALVLFGCVVVGSAFQTDDAFITFRTVQNVFRGDGLTWNPGERVQAYTHPAWLFLSLLCYGLTGECYFSVLILSLVLVLVLALALAHRLRASAWLAAACVLLLSASRAFTDYAACGLENPLLFLGCAGFAAALPERPEQARVGRLSALAAGLVLVRPDVLAMLAPSLAVCWFMQRERGRAALYALLGFSPLFAWELFSLVYYGAFVPNTAIAKLNVAVSRSSLAHHGALYLWDSLVRDPVTLLASAVCAALLWRRAGSLGRAAVLGALLYYAYLVRIGGDFMSGRFLGAPLVFLLSVVVFRLGAAAPSLRVQQLLAAGLAAYGVFWPRSPWHIDLDYGVGRSFDEIVLHGGVADERAYYYPSTGLLRVLGQAPLLRERGLPIPPYRGALLGRAFARSAQPLTVSMEVGFFGYFAEEKTVIDPWALTDAFLARLPFRAQGEYRVGHYTRPLPQGYVESRATGQNRLADPRLAHLYDEVRLVVSGPLFARERWRAIMALHGLCDAPGSRERGGR